MDHYKNGRTRKKTRILKNTLRRPVLDPMTPMPENITDMGVLTSMLPGSSIFIEKTTLYDICIENYSKNPNYYKEVFEFLLTQNQKKENFAELVVRLVDFTILNPKSDRGLLDAMEKHKGKINFNQTVFIPYRPQKSAERTDASDNDVREPSVSSSNSQKSGVLSWFESFDVLRNQKPAKPVGITMPLGKFLNSVSEVPGNENIAAFAEAIIPSENVVELNLTQHLTQPRECRQR